jgi:hypothetical protein
LLLSNITNSTEYVEKLAMEPETYRDIRDNFSGYIYSGYFKAPADAGYRFYVSVDDEAEFYFSSVTGKPEDMTLLYRSPGAT